MKIHDVPYRAIVPEKLDGLLMAGRCISATHLGAAAGKSMGNCMATGHAAGVAAAISAGKGIPPRDLKVSDIQASLRADGVSFDALVAQPLSLLSPHSCGDSLCRANQASR
jgi:succinate dehydrogenase/fumarate reductase flavoprotein subunit